MFYFKKIIWEEFFFERNGKNFCSADPAPFCTLRGWWGILSWEIPWLFQGCASQECGSKSSKGGKKRMENPFSSISPQAELLVGSSPALESSSLQTKLWGCAKSLPQILTALSPLAGPAKTRWAQQKAPYCSRGQHRWLFTLLGWVTEGKCGEIPMREGSGSLGSSTGPLGWDFCSSEDGKPQGLSGEAIPLGTISLQTLKLQISLFFFFVCFTFP